jgi:hypothetical protein
VYIVSFYDAKRQNHCQPNRLLKMPGYKLIPFLCFVMHIAHAQQRPSDTSLVASGEDYAKKIYQSQRNNLAPIYNGAQHFPYSPTIEGIAYFQADEWQPGNVVYDDILYENILMKYDLVKDQLIVTLQSGKGLPITLFSPRVKSFSFSGNKFIRIESKGNPDELPAGYYQVLTEGKLTALAKREKKIDLRIAGGLNYEKFEDIVRYYVIKDGKAFSISGKKDLMRLVKDKENEVEQFMDKEKLKYRKKTEQTIVSVANYYSQLSH